MADERIQPSVAAEPKPSPAVAPTPLSDKPISIARPWLSLSNAVAAVCLLVAGLSFVFPREVVRTVEVEKPVLKVIERERVVFVDKPVEKIVERIVEVRVPVAVPTTPKRPPVVMLASADAGRCSLTVQGKTSTIGSLIGNVYNGSSDYHLSKVSIRVSTDFGLRDYDVNVSISPRSSRSFFVDTGATNTQIGNVTVLAYYGYRAN